jgi:predicted heme/steroid binding protein
MGLGGRAVPAGAAAGKAPRMIARKELTEHARRGDGWLSFGGKVYDVSGWEDHPGGDVLFTHLGRDATDVMMAFHPDTAFEVLQRFYIGDLEGESAPAAPRSAFESDMRALRARLRREGAYEARCERLARATPAPPLTSLRAVLARFLRPRVCAARCTTP